jgi:hypothetical protein
MQQVKTAGSPVRQFFDAKLPDTAGVLARLRRGLLGAPTIAPPVDEIVGRYPYNEMGYASGIRLGLTFAAAVPRSALPRQLHPRTGLPWDSAAKVASEALECIADTAPHLRTLSREESERLCRYCYVLGLFDQLFRTGPLPNLRILQVDPDASSDELLALAPPACIRDLDELAAAAGEPLAVLAREPVVVSPVFAGSQSVGGADGDLIAGTCLVDFKAIKEPKLEARMIRQLVAYALLDYDDDYHLEEVAVYMARQARLLRISLEDVIALMSLSPIPLQDLRNDLRQALAR